MKHNFPDQSWSWGKFKKSERGVKDWQMKL